MHGVIVTFTWRAWDSDLSFTGHRVSLHLLLKLLLCFLRAGQLKGFTGIDDPYEEPENAELVIEAAAADGKLRRPEGQAEQILAYLREKGYLQVPPTV